MRLMGNNMAFRIWIINLSSSRERQNKHHFLHVYLFFYQSYYHHVLFQMGYIFLLVKTNIWIFGVFKYLMIMRC